MTPNGRSGRLLAALRRLYDDKDRFAAVALAISFLALGAGFGALAYTAVSNQDRADEIQRSRYDATLRSCESRNTDRRNIATRVQPRPPYTVADLERDFRPIAADCRVYARQQTATR